MASESKRATEVANAILDRITERLETLGSEAASSSHGQEIRDLAEAYAWLVAPAQPHGGHGPVRSGS